MPIQQVFYMCSGAPQITCDAADFDGTNDYMVKSGTFTGATDVDNGTLSFWCYAKGTTEDFHIADTAPTSGTFPFTLRLINSAGNTKFSWDLEKISGASQWGTTGASSQTRNAWHHYIYNWDISSDTSVLYVDGSVVTATSSQVGVDWNVEWSSASVSYHDFGSFAQGATNKLNGYVAEFWFAPGQTIDLSVSSNREKFRTTGGKPVWLGSDGSAPTGTKPTVYLHLDDGESAANWATNRAGNGNYTITGALATAASSPSD